ncbi:MAG: molybdopterin molybdotransferase MoeA [Actinomycetota bacterium]|jgi:molybdopterin molybdotransferase|nr:molybdopterin molybdotransferase MoeA [Actinomycetota bacterium]MCL6093216.1 molybdopterin molybdotransferase MoeA [Actinomycetota bacterium]MDA8167035.1 molybdopterin molybdotransferase MoeA [Actinomycetota bacterium]
MVTLKTVETMLAQAPLSPLRAESRGLEEAFGRYLARDIAAPGDLPPFTHSRVDGFAVRAADTRGASPAGLVHLKLCGRVFMGTAPTVAVGPGEAAAIPTGGMLPRGADAVIMSESTAPAGADAVTLFEALTRGENVVAAGEQARAGSTLLAAGKRLDAAGLGALAASGILTVEVLVPLHIGILSTGDELVDAGAEPSSGQIRDSNYFALAGLVRHSGAVPVPLGICPDDKTAIAARLSAASGCCQLILVSGGSSAGEADLTAAVVAGLADPPAPGMPATQPGRSERQPARRKRSTAALVGGVPVIGLPGQQERAIDIYRLLVDPVIQSLYRRGTGAQAETPPNPAK